MINEIISIQNRLIGKKFPPYIIAEISGNHNGDINRACALLDAAKNIGADAVKLQTYTADTITIDHNSREFMIEEGLWAGKTLYELYTIAHTPWEWHYELFSKARELNLTIFSSPFDNTAVELLEKLHAPAYKIASFEMVDLPLIQRVATTRKPVIISTGMANLDEIREATDCARSSGAEDIILLHCVSGYPTPANEANLRTIPDLESIFGLNIGLSDHTPGVEVAIAAVALGATVIEKHLTLSRSDGGPDAQFSLEPNEFKRLVDGCRTAWEALGEINYVHTPSEIQNKRFRRSLYVVNDIKAGEEFTNQNIRSIRPGFGLPPKYLNSILGHRAKCNVERGTPLSLDHVALDGNVE